MLAFVMLWAYFNLSQFLIIWSANLPEEIPFYLRRMQGGWQYLGIALIVFHFALPFLVLLSRDVKRHPRALAVVALGLLAARFLDLFWLLRPASVPGVLAVHWLDLATLIAVGGVWLWFVIGQLKSRPLLPIHDPSLPKPAREAHA